MKWVHLCLLAAVLVCVAGQNPPSPQCEECKLVISEAQRWVRENSTQEEVIQFLEQACKYLPFKSTCDKLFKAGEKLLVKLLTGLIDSGIICGEVQLCLYECCLTDQQPEQVHIAMTNDPSEMVISWATKDDTSSIVQYGLSPQYGNTANGFTWTYTAGGWRGTLHHAVLNSLKMNTKYYYRVGDGQNWSQGFWFNTRPALDDPSPINVIVVGDMGTSFSGQSMARITKLVQTGNYHFLLHNGDIAYADGYQPIWDIYFRMVEPIAAYLPYMTSPGNHDVDFDFASYRHRFYMPNMTDGSDDTVEAFYYSLDYRFTHIVSYATDGMYDMFLFAPGTSQYAWLEHDLKEYSQKIEKGDTFKWLLVMGHRPLYCTNVADDWGDCMVNAPMFRYWLEDLFHDTHVDVLIQAHEHSYERTYPVFQEKPVMTFHQPNTTTYIVNGAAGNREQLDTVWVDPTPSWSAFHLSAYGFATMQITPTSLSWQFIQDSDGRVVDSFVLTK